MGPLRGNLNLEMCLAETLGWTRWSAPGQRRTSETAVTLPSTIVDLARLPEQSVGTILALQHDLWVRIDLPARSISQFFFNFRGWACWRFRPSWRKHLGGRQAGLWRRFWNLWQSNRPSCLQVDICNCTFYHFIRNRRHMIYSLSLHDSLCLIFIYLIH